jgi:hypothetical protein
VAVTVPLLLAGCSSASAQPAGAAPATAAPSAISSAPATSPVPPADATTSVLPPADGTASSALPSADSPIGTAATAPGPADSAVHTFVSVGDSITAGSTAVQGIAPPGVGSWIQAAALQPLRYEGAWAVPGATTADMLAGVTPMAADTLILLGGTNDVLHGWDADGSLERLVAVADTVGIDDVVLVAIPPLDPHPAAAVAFNRRLAELAGQQRWRFVDPWEGIGENGVYLAGATTDGVHPVPEAADLVGRRIRAALLYGG